MSILKKADGIISEKKVKIGVVGSGLVQLEKGKGKHWLELEKVMTLKVLEELEEGIVLLVCDICRLKYILTRSGLWSR